MRYDPEYDSYKFSSIELEIVLNALSYANWNDRSINEHDRGIINSIYKSLDNGKINYESTAQRCY